MAPLGGGPRPVIGITGPDRGGIAAWLFTMVSVWRAGGRPKRITPSSRRAIEELDGLIVGGGADVDPALYGEEAETFLGQLKEKKEKEKKKQSLIGFLIRFSFFPFLYLVRRLFSLTGYAGLDAARDSLEYALIDRAVKARLPVMGICRGAQLLNVYFGGTLYQDISEFYVEVPQVRTIFPEKYVRIEPNTRLAEILKTLSCQVNVLHRQAVKSLGRGLVIAAREQNGVIQAIEHRSLPFVIGVQWHPEFMPHRSHQSLLFAALVAAARRKK